MSRYGLGYVFKIGTRWHVRFSQHGKQYREATGIVVGGEEGSPEYEKSKEKADKFLRRRLAEIQFGKFIPRQDRLSVEEVLDSFLANQKMRGLRSLRSTAIVLKHVRAYFHGDRAIVVTPTRLRDYVNQRQQEKAAPASIQRELAHLRTALGLAVDDGRLSAVPKFPSIRVDNAREGFIELADFERLHAELPEELRDIATFLYWSGWRSNEAKTLEWKDVDLGGGEIRLRSANSKTAEGRTLPLFGAIKELITRRHAGRRLAPDPNYVFTQSDGRQLGRLNHRWSSAARRAGLGKLTPHDCRRSAIRNLTRAGVSQHVAMSWSGHKSISVFQRYNIISGDDLTRAAQQLAAFAEAESLKSSNVFQLARTSPKTR